MKRLITFNFQSPFIFNEGAIGSKGECDSPLQTTKPWCYPELLPLSCYKTNYFFMYITSFTSCIVRGTLGNAKSIRFGA